MGKVLIVLLATLVLGSFGYMNSFGSEDWVYFSSGACSDQGILSILYKKSQSFFR